MREIKFRAWNGRELFNVDVLAISPCTWDCPDYGKRGVSLAYQPHIKVMQYTGMKDKNGVEIYEGDVLRVQVPGENVPNRDSGGGIIDFDYEEGFSQLGVVGFTRCSFDFKTVKTECGRQEEIHAPIDWIEDYEVIGNIYENPELLS